MPMIATSCDVDGSGGAAREALGAGELGSGGGFAALLRGDEGRGLSVTVFVVVVVADEAATRASTRACRGATCTA
jgi:hypothetical protein